MSSKKFEIHRNVNTDLNIDWWNAHNGEVRMASTIGNEQAAECVAEFENYKACGCAGCLRNLMAAIDNWRLSRLN